MSNNDYFGHSGSSILVKIPILVRSVNSNGIERVGDVLSNPPRSEIDILCPLPMASIPGVEEIELVIPSNFFQPSSHIALVY